MRPEGQALRDWARRASGLPPGLWHQTFRNLEPRPDIPAWEEAVAYAIAYSWNLPGEPPTLGHQEAVRPWLWLHGPPGTGKTHLAAAILNLRHELFALSRGLMCEMLGSFSTVEDWLDGLRDGVETQHAQARYQRAATVPLLVLDDLGAHYITPYALAKLDQMLDHRYRERLCTVVTTNPQVALSPRLEDRLHDNRVSRWWNLVGSSYRRQSHDIAHVPAQPLPLQDA